MSSRRAHFPPVEGRLVGCFYDRDEVYTGCYDCGRQYGGAYGFPDLIVPDDVWRRISPKGGHGGLLCPSCIVRRCAQENIQCEAVWASGPFCMDGTARPDPANTVWPDG